MQESLETCRTSWSSDARAQLQWRSLVSPAKLNVSSSSHQRLSQLLGTPEVLWCCCAALAEPSEHMWGHCGVPACLYPNWPPDTLLCAVKYCAIPLSGHELSSCCLQGVTWPGSARLATTTGSWGVHWAKVSALPLCCAQRDMASPQGDVIARMCLPARVCTAGAWLRANTWRQNRTAPTSAPWQLSCVTHPWALAATRPIDRLALMFKTCPEDIAALISVLFGLVGMLVGMRAEPLYWCITWLSAAMRFLLLLPVDTAF